MKEFKVIVYRKKGWFRKIMEEWTVKADDFSSYKGVVSFSVNGKTPCDLPDCVAEFQANEYTVVEKK